jgi:hypothetical protein
MRTMLLALALFGAACHHDTAPQDPASSPAPVPTTANNDDIGSMPVDPTLPSWVPRSCTAYHAAVVKLAECDAVSQEARNTVKTQYDTDNAKWQAMHGQAPDATEAVRASCTSSLQAVKGQNTCLAQNQDRTGPEAAK